MEKRDNHQVHFLSSVLTLAEALNELKPHTRVLTSEQNPENNPFSEALWRTTRSIGYLTSNNPIIH